MEQQIVFEPAVIKCDKCDKELVSQFQHCRNCYRNHCENCEVREYSCAGYHYFSETACDLCIPEYGRIFEGDYYCPECAPSSAGAEYNFKKAVFEYFEKFVREMRHGRHPSIEYLNDPVNWERYQDQRNREILEKEWREMMSSKKLF